MDQYLLGEDFVVELPETNTKDLSIDEEEQNLVENFFQLRNSQEKLEVEKIKEESILKKEEVEVQWQMEEQCHLAQDHPFTIEPQQHGADPIRISIKTQIQTNRRTNIYLDAEWPEDLVGKKMPIYYYPPLEKEMHEQLKSIEEPGQLWLTEMLRYYYGSATYLEVQFWLKTKEGKMQLISKCDQHSSLIKMPGQQAYPEKSLSHDEVKWTRNTAVFGVNFNCTRTCFKSELFVFVRVRHGNLFMESTLIELPFRRSEKRKHDHDGGKQQFSAKKQHTVEVLKPISFKPEIVPMANVEMSAQRLVKVEVPQIKVEDSVVKVERPALKMEDETSATMSKLTSMVFDSSSDGSSDNESNAMSIGNGESNNLIADIIELNDLWNLELWNNGLVL